MKLKIDDEFKQICSEIIKENKTDEEWEETQSGDMFQSEHYCGGYEDLDEDLDGEFCFSYYSDHNKEYWFQISLNDLPKILSNEIQEIDLRIADKWY
jgi:hypothetical protein